MRGKHIILIADSNIHVRSFLARELNDPDYEIIQAANHIQLFAKVFGNQTPDLIVLDPDIPYISCLDVLRRLLDITPPIPVIVYTYLPEYKDHPLVRKTRGFVEKSGDISALRERIAEALISNGPGPDGGAYHSGR
ncbi:MAG: response regulator [Thermodesulfobacteriota bacterium]